MDFIAYRKADLNITAIQNDTLQASFQLIDDDCNPVNLSNYNFAKCQIKESELGSALMTLYSTGNTGSTFIDITQLSLGIVTLKSPILAVSAGGYQFDVELRNSTTIETIAGGLFTIIPDITH